MPAAAKPRLAYLFSRYPVVSQTFCDSEMLALERFGFQIEIGSLNRPPNSFRHERLDRLRAEIHYPPPTEILEAATEEDSGFQAALGGMIREHEERHGASFKPAVRARNAWYFGRKFRELGVQHVHVHFANRATHTALFLKKLGLPFSFTAHAQDFMVDLGSEALLAEMVREAEFVVAVSDFSRALLLEMCPGEDHKVVRIYNGIELDDFPRAGSQPSGGALRIVSIGRLIEFKGFQYLIQACGLLKRRGVAVDARIIGEGPWRAQLQDLIAREGVQDSVQLLGVRSQEEIKELLGQADVFALASIVDSAGASDILPTVITEAMACALPVLSTTVAGIPEMVVDGTTGLLVPPKDAPALADAIARLAGDADLRRDFGQAGRQHAENLFSLDRTAAVLGERFQSLADADRLPKAMRSQMPVVYLMQRWYGERLAGELPGPQDGVRWLAAEARWPQEGGDCATLETMETLPDAAVIESLWLRHAARRQQVEAVRGALGDAVDGASFYQAARHAVYLADALPRRGVRHLHAFRSDALVTVWLVRQLLPGLRISGAVEEQPSLGRSLLARLLPDFDLVSVSDEKLRQQAKVASPDVLRLGLPFHHRELALGPVRLKRRVAGETVDRPQVERAWLNCILESLP